MARLTILKNSVISTIGSKIFPKIAVAIAVAVAGTTLHTLATVETAQALSFTNQADFDAATIGLNTINFEGIATPPFSQLNNSTTISGVTFNAPSGQLFVVTPAYNNGAFDYGTGDVLEYQLVPTLRITLPTATTAAGFDISSWQDFAVRGVLGNFTVSVSNGDTFSVNTQATNLSFFGFTSSTPFTSISIVNNTTPFTVLDNFSFGQTSAKSVPEPSATLGFITILGVVLVSKRLGCFEG